MDTNDLAKLAGALYTDNSRIPYEENKHRFTKVAFDVFQLNGSPVESLWILEEGDDGKQYLAAMYEDLQETDQLGSQSHWETLRDKTGSNVTLFYKEIPIKRFASSDYGFSKDDVHVFEKTLIEKLTEKDFVDQLLNSQPQNVQEFLVKKFPELA